MEPTFLSGCVALTSRQLNVANRSCDVSSGGSRSLSSQRELPAQPSARQFSVRRYRGVRIARTDAQEIEIYNAEQRFRTAARKQMLEDKQAGFSLKMAGERQPIANPYRLIGVSESADYEEIENAAKLLKEQAAGDEDRMSEIEAAQNQIFSMKLKERMKAQPKIDLARLGFGPKGRPSIAIGLPEQFPKWKDIKEAYRWDEMFDHQPERRNMINTGVILGSLAVVSLLSAQSVATYVPLGTLCCLAFHFQKQKKWIRSIPLTAGSLGIGWGLGTLLPRFGFPIFGLAVSQFAGLLTYTLMWLVCNFLS